MKEKFKSLFGNLNKSYSHFEGKAPKKNGTLKAFIIILIFFLTFIRTVFRTFLYFFVAIYAIHNNHLLILFTNSFL